MPSPNRLVIFDDDRGRLGPMTDLRAAFEVRTGVYTTAHRLAARWPKTLAGYWVPPRLARLVAARANAPVNVLPDEEIIDLVNGRWGLPADDPGLAPGEALIEPATGHVIAACLRRADAQYFLETGELSERIAERTETKRVLYRHPWDVLDVLSDAIRFDIEAHPILDEQLGAGAVMGNEAVSVHAGAMIAPGVVLDATQGPILIEDGARIRPNAVLAGPCSVGLRSIVQDNAVIRPNTVIGPLCKVGGEVGGTIFQGCANKAHDGYVGDSWIGKWANLGAGTVTSNLLNTYGEITVRLEPNGPRMRTGRMFLGSIIGDHVKTAIGTRLMTGTVIGTGAMIASSTPPPSTVPRFGWITDDGTRTYRLGKFIDVMSTVMARRARTPNDAYLAVLQGLHDGTA